MTRERERGLHVKLIDQRLDDLTELFRQATVFFSVPDRNQPKPTPKVVGSGVVVDILGQKVILTAGHVLNDFRAEFDAENVHASIKVGRGAFRIKNAIPRLVDSKTDAGIIVLPAADGNAYFDFGSLSPARARTLSEVMPEIGLECIVVGFPSAASQTTEVESPWTIETKLTGGMWIIASDVIEVDEVFAWLNAEGIPVGMDGALTPGELGGMSGCGCWTIEVDRESKDVLFSLQAIHSGTGVDRLREVPVLHHLNLLAAMNRDMREKIKSAYPRLATDWVRDD